MFGLWKAIDRVFASVKHRRRRVGCSEFDSIERILRIARPAEEVPDGLHCGGIAVLHRQRRVSHAR